MTFWQRAIGSLFLCASVLTAGAAGPYGTDVGWTVDHSSAQIYFTSTVANQLSQGEVGWVRVEASLVSGHTNWDATMLGYYDTVVNNAHNAGLQVLMLIDGGSCPGSQTNWCANNSENTSGANGDNPYVEAYATNAVVPLVLHFHDRVKVFELWNEPNSWTSSPSNGVYVGGTFVYPSNFGWLLTRSWEAIHQTYHLSDVTLFSGGVFGLSSYGTSYSAAGGQYLDDTYSTGTNLIKGGSFAHTKTTYGAYPLDGIGQHIYITQGGLVSSNTFRQYEDWVHSALTKYEGTNSLKKTFITEFGWQTTNSGNANGVSAAIQDTNLITAFSVIQATPYVQMAIWFDWVDSPAGGLWYGVLNSAGAAKVSYPDFQRAEHFEGLISFGVTNTGIQTYFSRLGQAILGSPLDAGHGPWVYTNLNGFSQDFYGGSHSNLTLFTSTNGTFEVNNLYGFWSYFNTTNNATNCGPPIDNSFVSNGGIRQDFSLGYLSWDATNLVVWHVVNNLPPAPTALATVPANVQNTLSWNAAPTATSYKVYTATSATGPFTLNTTVVGSPAYTDAPLNNGTTYFYEVSAVNSYGEGPVSAPANGTPQAVIGNLPAPWQDADVGSVNLAGAAGYSTGNPAKFLVYGSGADVGGPADAFHFAYQPLMGNGTIIARVKSQSATNAWAKAGVLIRESTGSNAVSALADLTPGNGVQFQWRALTGGGTTNVAGPAATAPYWLKLTRTGSNFTAFAASDGTNYVLVGSTNLIMATNACAGLAACSHNTNVLNTVVFDNVTVTPQAAPAWLTATPGNVQVVLVWPATTGATGYDIKRSTVTGGPYTTVATGIIATNFADSTATNGTLFYYVVAATNNAGEGPFSPEASALPVAPPQITQQPQAQMVNQGAAVQFTTAATSTVPFTCQWLFNGQPITGAVTTSYGLANVQPAGMGNYAAVFSNYGGAATSAPAALLVRPLLVMSANGVLSWSGTYTLQRATNVVGPYVNLNGQGSPYTNFTTLPQQFFRLQF